MAALAALGAVASASAAPQSLSEVRQGDVPITIATGAGAPQTSFKSVAHQQRRLRGLQLPLSCKRSSSRSRRPPPRDGREILLLS